MKKILFLENIHERTFTWLKNHNEIEVVFINEILEQEFEEIDGIVTRGIGIVNEELLAKCPQLSVVVRCGVGLDNIATETCKSKNIKVIYAPGSNAQTTAEHTLALMLNLQRNIFKAISDVKNGNWHFRNQHTSDELYGKTLGILGLGNIGYRVAKMAEAFGMHVVYWSKNPKENEFKFLPFDDLLKISDVLSIHLPLNNQTQNLFNKSAFVKCKKGVLIVNTARANIFQKEELIQALDNGTVGGYAADVPMSPMPKSGDPLNEHNKTLITPHVSSLTEATYYKMCQFTIENLVKVLCNETPDPNSILK
ncbi:MAG: hypothetical protein RLZZ546_1134 [Bacteroidota bacterium]|jgi:D-3-phosphoglycerate dehydrogenase